MKNLLFSTFENKWNRRCFFAVLGLAIFLRLILSIVNSDANDSHHEVTMMILGTGKLPDVKDCWQCYHPKLYHLTCALFYKLVPVSEPSQIRMAQLINVVASLFLLALLLKFIAQQPWSERIKLLVFSFFALNPGLIGINIQATNDTFVILFSSLSIYFIWKYVRQPSWKYGGLTILFILLAAISKASGLAMFIAGLLALGIQALASLKKNSFWLHVKAGAALSILFFLIVPFAGSYYANYKKVGRNFTTNIPISEKPFFFKKTYPPGERLGVTSIFDALFTFRFIDMLRHPYVTYEDMPLYVHRTSLWSHIYGRMCSIHYDHWPPSWVNKSPFILNLTRAQLILGLFPAALFIIGFMLGLIKENSALKWPPPANYIFLCFMAVMFALYFKRLCDHRDINMMKIIYLFPLILCFTFYFGEGMKWFFQKSRPVFVKIFEAGMVLLLLLGVLDALLLLPDLLPAFLTIYSSYFHWLLD